MGEDERAGSGAGSARLAALDGFEAVEVVEKTLYGGVDPGKQGHIAVIDDTEVVETYEMPVVGKTYDLGGIARLCRDFKARGVVFVMLERQQPAYNRGKEAANNSFTKASFNIGYGYALWQMAFYMVGMPHDVVMPTVWKRKMGVLAPSHIKDTKARQKAAKEASIAAVQQMYPTLDLRRNERARTPSSDKAEAILLARYGMQHVVARTP